MAAADLLSEEAHQIFQGTQGDFMEREEGGLREPERHSREGESSQSRIPSSQMSAFQSRLHQRIGGLGASSAYGRPTAEASQGTNNRSPNENVTAGPQSGQPWAASSHMLGASTSLTPSLSQGPSPAVFPKRELPIVD